jgi:hypothetical protein
MQDLITKGIIKTKFLFLLDKLGPKFFKINGASLWDWESQNEINYFWTFSSVIR